MNQSKVLKEYLEENGSITSMEALLYLGISRCASRVHDLKKSGIDISKTMIKVPNRQGRKVKVAQYHLADYYVF